MKPIQAGELCFLRGCVLQDNNGRVVTTVERYCHAVLGEGWTVISQTKFTTITYMTDGSTPSSQASQFFVLESQLIPIRDNDGETDECSRIRSPEIPNISKEHA